MTYNEAKRLIDTLDSDPETLSALKAYINEQRHGPKDWDNFTDRQCSNSAMTHADEALSIVGTTQSEVRRLNGEVDALQAKLKEVDDLRASLKSMDDTLTGVLTMLDEKGLL